MPLRDYICDECGTVMVDVIERIGDAPPKCHGPMRARVAAPNVVMAGPKVAPRPGSAGFWGGGRQAHMRSGRVDAVEEGLYDGLRREGVGHMKARELAKAAAPESVKIAEKAAQ